MEWREVVENPSLKDLPFKIETNEWGKFMMTPASYAQGKYQSRINGWFERNGEGHRASVECPIQTSRGTRVADVAWAGTAFHKKHGVRELVLPESPELIVEIESPANSFAESEEKKLLYFEAGAAEFWLCNKDGDMRFFNRQGEIVKSEMFPDFPTHIDIDLL